MKRTLLIIHDIVFLLMGLLFMVIGTFAEMKAGMYDVDGWLVFFAGIIGVRVYADSLKERFKKN